MTKHQQDIVALLRLFEYAKGEVQRLGLDETARLFDLPMISIVHELEGRFGARLLEDQRDADEKPAGRAH